MTIYQKEFERRLAAFNCMGELDEKSGMLNISMNGIPPVRHRNNRRPLLGQRKPVQRRAKGGARRAVQDEPNNQRICQPLRSRTADESGRCEGLPAAYRIRKYRPGRHVQ